MRKFYQIYYDSYQYMSDNTKVKLITALQTEFKADINTLEKDSHQFIIRFNMPEEKFSEELKIGGNFIQISSSLSAERCKQIFDVLEPIIPIDNLSEEVPF